MQHLEAVRNILTDVLNLGDRGGTLTENSILLGSLPELDSMAVVNVITAIEEHFDISVDDDEISASTFETLGSLARFIEQKLGIEADNRQRGAQFVGGDADKVGLGFVQPLEAVVGILEFGRAFFHHLL